MSLFRVEKLIDLACSTTHEEEARTAALAACRLIRKHSMRLSVEGASDPLHGRRRRSPWPDAEPGPPPPRSRAAAAEPVREKPPNGGAFARATRTSRCESCGGRIASGDEVYVVAGVSWCTRH